MVASHGDRAGPSAADDLDAVDRVGYDPRTGTYHARHDVGSAEPVYHTVVTAVAAVTGHRPTDLPPLSETLDPDALDTLITGQGSDVQVGFGYGGCAVTVDSTGHVELDPGD